MRGHGISMIYVIFFLICFFSCIAGAICGIGGGVIIKPVMDAFGVMDVATISFLSGCTVLSMTAYSVAKSKLGGESHVEKKIGVPLAVGAAFGGLLGKWMFSFVASLSPDKNRVGAVQAFCLMLVTIGTLIYTLYKERIKTYHVKGAAVCLMIGLVLGILSSFLGIGGGPMNLVVLFFFFSMETKIAAENSLYIILFSQIASFLSTVAGGNVPQFQPGVLLLMIAGGILGGICGRKVNKKIDGKTVDKLFMGLMVLIICINIYNIYKFLN